MLINRRLHYNTCMYCLLLPPLTDINECLEDPCEQICTDLEGGYECSCREGYQLLSGGRCTGENRKKTDHLQLAIEVYCGHPCTLCY